VTTTSTPTAEQLLAALREALHDLEELESDTRGRVEAEARVERARAAFLVRHGTATEVAAVERQLVEA
jgi:hypothetical protein